MKTINPFYTTIIHCIRQIYGLLAMIFVRNSVVNIKERKIIYIHYTTLIPCITSLRKTIKIVLYNNYTVYKIAIPNFFFQKNQSACHFKDKIKTKKIFQSVDSKKSTVCEIWTFEVTKIKLNRKEKVIKRV